MTETAPNPYDHDLVIDQINLINYKLAQARSLTDQAEHLFTEVRNLAPEAITAGEGKRLRMVSWGELGIEKFEQGTDHYDPQGWLPIFPYEYGYFPNITVHKVPIRLIAFEGNKIEYDAVQKKLWIYDEQTRTRVNCQGLIRVVPVKDDKEKAESAAAELY